MDMFGIDRMFSILPKDEQAAVLSYGSSLRLLDLRKRLALAQSKTKTFQAKYNISLSELDAQGLPDHADVTMHEDYILWHHWEQVTEETQSAIQLLEALAGAGIPLREVLYAGVG